MESEIESKRDFSTVYFGNALVELSLRRSDPN